MTDDRKKRLAMLDTLAAAGAPAAMAGNSALRSARDAVDGHRVWDLDPAAIDDIRLRDRLDPGDVQDLRASIEANGQTVPILVRRHPAEEGRYLLVYGRRRLEAVRGSDRIGKVRALIASLDDSAAIRAQVSENTARRDLSYIERALFAQELLDSGFGNQSQIAEVLNSTRSAISMALSVAAAVGPDLARAIGPAHGIGRPRWEALAATLGASDIDPADLILAANAARAAAQLLPPDESRDPSAGAFLAVAALIGRRAAQETPARKTARPLTLEGVPLGQVQRTARGLRLDLQGGEAAFLAWLEEQAQGVIEELHGRWRSGL